MAAPGVSPATPQALPGAVSPVVPAPVSPAVVAPPLDLAPGLPALDRARQLIGAIVAWLTRPLTRDLIAVVVFAATTGVFFWNAIAHHIIAYENDTRIFYYPLFVRLGEAVKAGTLPLWSPQVFTGYPMFADGEAGALYPLHLLLLLALPVDTAFVWLRPVRFFQAALFTYLFCRTLGIGRYGAVIGGLAFAFSGFAIAQLHHTNVSTAAVWLPLALAFGELALRFSGRQRYGFAVLAGVAFGLQGLIIHVQVVLMSGAVFAAYCAYRALTGPIGQGPGPAAVVRALAERAVERAAVAGSTAMPRVFPPPQNVERAVGRAAVAIAALLRLSLAVAITGIAGMTGAALSAVQLLPLYELSTFSFRGAGVDYSFASQYSLPPVQLLSLLLPNFFVANDQYWGLWSRWEVFAYVGIAPLVLALCGLVLARHRTVAFFALLGAGSLVLALGEHSPFGVHRLLAGLPGFSVLRAPGRFIFLFTLAIATLAALGADALAREFRIRRATGAGTTTVSEAVRAVLLMVVLLSLQVLAMLTPVLLSLASAFVEGQKDSTMVWLQHTFVRARGYDTRFTAEHLYQFLNASLDITQPSTIRQIALLTGSVGVLVIWERLRTLGPLWQAALVALVAVDLVGLGQRFHPQVPLERLREPSGVAAYLAASPGLYRVYTMKGSRDEPNRLMAFDLAEANGYSSLEPDRHQRYAGKVEYAPNRLLDLMNARYLAVKNTYAGLPSFNLTSYDQRRPLLSSTARNGSGVAAFNVGDVPADSLRIVSTMRWASAVLQGEPVARITLVESSGRQTTYRLLAGVHTAEWAIERPDLRGRVPHQRAQPAYTWQQRDGRAPPFPAYLYYAEFPLGGRLFIRRVEVQFLHPVAQVEIYGISLFDDQSKDLEQLDRSKLQKLRRVYADQEVILYENQDYLPRAFLVPSVVVENPGEEILERMGQGDFSPERFVILDERFDTSRLAAPAPAGQPLPPIRFNQPLGTEITSGPGTTHIVRFDPDHLRFEVTARQNAMLFVADHFYPGWKAYLDGVETPIHRANYLFRAVYVPAGQHTIDMVYRPRSFRLGLLVTLVATVATLVALAVAMPGSRRLPRGDASRALHARRVAQGAEEQRRSPRGDASGPVEGAPQTPSPVPGAHVAPVAPVAAAATGWPPAQDAATIERSGVATPRVEVLPAPGKANAQRDARDAAKGAYVDGGQEPEEHAEEDAAEEGSQKEIGPA